LNMFSSTISTILFFIYIVYINGLAYQHKGCRENLVGKLKYMSTHAAMNPNLCYNKCVVLVANPGPYYYFGIKSGNLCYCGDSISVDTNEDNIDPTFEDFLPPRWEENDCSYTCYNDTSSTCGGLLYFDVFRSPPLYPNAVNDQTGSTTGNTDRGLESWVYVVISIGSVVFLLASILFLAGAVYKIRGRNQQQDNSSLSIEAGIPAEE